MRKYLLLTVVLLVVALVSKLDYEDLSDRINGYMRELLPECITIIDENTGKERCAANDAEKEAESKKGIEIWHKIEREDEERLRTGLPPANFMRRIYGVDPKWLLPSPEAYRESTIWPSHSNSTSGIVWTPETVPTMK